MSKTTPPLLLSILCIATAWSQAPVSSPTPTAPVQTLPPGVPDVSSIAVPWPPPHDAKDSPFAKMTCSSYGSYKVGTNMINPLWGESDPWDFGPRKVVFDMTGVKMPNQIPAPGIHPRIYCTPADHDDIAHRLKETECGREMWKNLLCNVNYMNCLLYTSPSPRD